MYHNRVYVKGLTFIVFEVDCYRKLEKKWLYCNIIVSRIKSFYLNVIGMILLM